MPIDILALIAGIAKIAPALSKVIETINTLMRKWFVIKKSELKLLKTDLEEVIDKMNSVGMMGEVLEGYIKYYLGSYTIHTTSDKLIEIVNRYDTDLSDKNSAHHESSWEIVETPFRDIKEVRSMYIKVTLQRVNYLDSKDAEQVNIYVTEFNKQYEKGNTYLREKNVKEFKKCIDDMSEHALNLYKIFDDGINGMVNSLISMKKG